MAFSSSGSSTTRYSIVIVYFTKATRRAYLNEKYSPNWKHIVLFVIELAGTNITPKQHIRQETGLRTWTCAARKTPANNRGSKKFYSCTLGGGVGKGGSVGGIGFGGGVGKGPGGGSGIGPGGAGGNGSGGGSGMGPGGGGGNVPGTGSGPGGGSIGGIMGFGPNILSIRYNLLCRISNEVYSMQIPNNVAYVTQDQAYCMPSTTAMCPI